MASGQRLVKTPSSRMEFSKESRPAVTVPTTSSRPRWRRTRDQCCRFVGEAFRERFFPRKYNVRRSIPVIEISDSEPARGNKRRCRIRSSPVPWLQADPQVPLPGPRPDGNEPPPPPVLQGSSKANAAALAILELVPFRQS